MKEHGRHADEIEASLMLSISPAIVRREKAVADGVPDRPGPLTHHPEATSGLSSPSGVFGDARLATRAKGEAVVEGFLADVLAEIDALALLFDGKAARSRC